CGRLRRQLAAAPPAARRPAVRGQPAERGHRGVPAARRDARARDDGADRVADVPGTRRRRLTRRERSLRTIPSFGMSIGRPVDRHTHRAAANGGHLEGAVMNAATHITGIRTVSIPVDHQESALPFYVDTLGFTLLRDTPTPNGGRWIELAPV